MILEPPEPRQGKYEEQKREGGTRCLNSDQWNARGKGGPGPVLGDRAWGEGLGI